MRMHTQTHAHTHARRVTHTYTHTFTHAHTYVIKTLWAAAIPGQEMKVFTGLKW